MDAGETAGANVNVWRQQKPQECIPQPKFPMGQDSIPNKSSLPGGWTRAELDLCSMDVSRWDGKGKAPDIAAFGEY